ncbi:MAG: restriction endonuclease subunit S [Geobacteraceae bacterium]|nr:restriction endonuclease subunit S [Geobacteraceae bacterium]
MTPETFFANFGHVADAPNGVQKLRDLILSIAFQGKLVPQDPQDEPVSVLLEQIKEEKERLVLEKKIKKAELLPPVGADEAPYELPKGWDWARLGDIGLIGSSSRVHQKDWRARGVPFYRAREIVKLSKCGSVDNDLFISEELYESLTAGGLVPMPGDLMITGVGTIGVPYVVKEEDRFYFKDASVLIFKNHFNIFPFYLLQFFRSPLWNSSIHKESMGTTVHTLTIARANETLVPLPPLTEQHRIVAKVDLLMSLCDELEKRQQRSRAKLNRLNNAALDRLLYVSDTDSLDAAWRLVRDNFDLLYTTPDTIAKLRQTILQLAVQGKLVPQDPNDEPATILRGRIKEEKSQRIEERSIKEPKFLDNLEDFASELPSSWIKCFLGDLTIFGPQNGYSPRGVDYQTDTKVLTLSATTRGYFDPTQWKYADVDIEKSSNLWLEPGDLLIQRGNSLDYVGIGAVYEGDRGLYIYPDLMMKLKFSKFINTKYALFIINSNPSREFFKRKASGTSGSMPKVNQVIVNSLPFPLPPIAEQHRIVTKVDQLMALCDELESKLAKSQAKAEKFATTAVKALLAA